MIMLFGYKIRRILVRCHGYDSDGYTNTQQVSREKTQEQKETLQVSNARNFATYKIQQY